MRHAVHTFTKHVANLLLRYEFEKDNSSGDYVFFIGEIILYFLLIFRIFGANKYYVIFKRQYDCKNLILQSKRITLKRKIRYNICSK